MSGERAPHDVGSAASEREATTSAAGSEATTPAGEPEPAWADAIRRGRRARAERLREVFARFDEDPLEGGP